MKLIDTHSHLYLEDFDVDRDELISAARDFGVRALLLPNIDRTSIDRLHQLCDSQPGFCYPMMGLHPTSVGSDYVAELSALEKCLNKRSYCAIGEIGIDLYWDKTFLDEQKEVFEEQLRWSIAYSLPVSIHTRNAFVEVFDSIYKVGAEKLKGVFHCFSGTEAELKEILLLKKFKLGINGIITYKNSDLPDLLKRFATIKDVVLETDAPYLPPVPYRGKRNIPIYMAETITKVADVFDLSIAEASCIIEENSEEIFTTIC